MWPCGWPSSRVVLGAWPDLEVSLCGLVALCVRDDRSPGARIASLRALLDSLTKRHEEEGRPVDAAADDLEVATRSVISSETLVESLPGKKPGT